MSETYERNPVELCQTTIDNINNGIYERYDISKCDWDVEPDILQLECLNRVCQAIEKALPEFETVGRQIVQKGKNEGELLKIVRNVAGDHPAHHAFFSILMIFEACMDILKSNNLITLRYPHYYKVPFEPVRVDDDVPY